jgi:hypothetical protein
MDQTIPLFTLAAVAAAFVATLVLAGLLTPKSWWRRLTAGNVALVVGMTWLLSSAFLMLAPPAVKASSYRVADTLNLRSNAGTSSTRVAVVPAGALIHATGKRHGDWWELKALVDGKQVTGWSNSLWLRRTDEARLHVDAREHGN